MEENDIRSKVITPDVTFMESTSPRYHDRTVVNAGWADRTVAFASDFSTAGERLTRTAAGDSYIPIRMPSSAEECRDADVHRRAARYLFRKTEGMDHIRLNIAGNGLENLLKAGLSQADADAFVSGVLGEALALGMSLSEVRSGGQSGIDEAGTKAAVAYGISASVLMPRGWLYNDARGLPHWNRSASLSRFEGIQRHPVPKEEFDVKKAFQQEQASSGTSYRPGLDSRMLGAVAGDIIGSPFLFREAGGVDFELFSPTRTYQKGGDSVNHHPSPGVNTVLVTAVATWLTVDDTRDGERLRRLIDQSVSEFRVTSNNIAVAASVVGLAAANYLEAKDLSSKVVRALGADPQMEKGARAAAEAVFMASHGRDRHEIKFTMDLDYGLDVSLAQAGLLAQQLRREGKDDDAIAGDVLQMHGFQIGRTHADGDSLEDRVYTMDEILPRTHVLEERTVQVNGEPFSWLERTDRRDVLSENAVPVALACFMDTFSYEEAVRKAVSAGGDSSSIAALAGAVASAYYGGIPQDLAARCEILMDSPMSASLDRFCETLEGVERESSYARNLLPSADVWTFHGERFAVWPHKDLNLTSELQRAGITLVSGSEMEMMRREVSDAEKATHLDIHSGGFRTLYLTDEGLRGISDVRSEGLPPIEDRQRARLLYEDLKRYCEDVHLALERRTGFSNDHSEQYRGSLRFDSAYWPSVKGDRIEIMEGSLVAGAVSIDQSNGLMRVQWDGDYRDGEYRDADWCRERVFDSSKIVTLPGPESVSLQDGWRKALEVEGVRMSSEEMRSLATMQRASSPFTEDVDGLKSAVARFCLDEGVGLGDDRMSNLERAGQDVINLARDLSLHLSSHSSHDSPSLHQPRSEAYFNAVSHWSEGYRVVVKDGRFNLEGSDGSLLLNGWYGEVRGFENGYARVRMDDGLWNYVDRTGHALLHGGVEKAEAFREGYAAVRKDGLWNYVGTDGRCIGRTWFERASSFVDGKAVVRKDGRDVMMDRDGHLSSERKQGRGHGL